MEITDILQWIPIQIIIVVFAGTYGIKKMFVPNGGKAPKLFLLVPFGIGFCFAFLWYFNTTDPAVFKELPGYLKIVRPIYQAVLSAFVSIFAWEFLWKKYLAKKFGDTSNPPTLPPGSQSPLEPKP